MSLEGWTSCSDLQLTRRDFFGPQRPAALACSWLMEKCVRPRADHRGRVRRSVPSADSWRILQTSGGLPWARSQKRKRAEAALAATMRGLRDLVQCMRWLVIEH